MWRYTPVANVCLELLLSCLLGAAMAALGVVTPRARNALSAFVFNVALPLLVARGIALRVDFYDRSTYPFIGVFLLLRLLALLAAAVAVSLRRAVRARASSVVHPFDPPDARDAPPSPTPFSRVAEIWLGLSWISTVVVGVPVLTAALGSERTALTLALLASMSSFIFQLPGILILLEAHEAAAAAAATEARRGEEDPASSARVGTTLPPPPTAASPRILLARVLARLARNPVLWGILVGVALSVSRAGPKWLDPDDPAARGGDLSRYLAFVAGFAERFGRCVTPAGMFITGAWMGHRATEPTARGGGAHSGGGPPRSAPFDDDPRSEFHAVPPTSPPRPVPSAPPLPPATAFEDAPPPADDPEHLDHRRDDRSRPPINSPHHHRSSAPPRSLGGVGVTLAVFVGKAAATPAACYAIARGFALSETDVRGATLLASLPISVASVALTERHRAPSDVVAANVCLGVACLLPVTLAWAALLDYAGADDPGVAY
jgi:predicted permease